MRGSRALTLAETMVAGSVFALLAVMAAWIQHTGLEAYTMRAQRDDAEREVFLAYAQISQAVADARVQVAGSTLKLAPPLLSNGNVLLGSDGAPQYGAYTVSFQLDAQGRLVRSGPDGDSVVARLGPAAQVQYQLTDLSGQGSALLKVIIGAGDKPGSLGCRQVTGQTRLRNQP